VNLGLRVKPPRGVTSTSWVGTDGLCDFDALDATGVRAIRLILGSFIHPRTGVGQKRAAIAELIDSLPPVSYAVAQENLRYSCIRRLRR
jgi:hypothetical protein